MSDLFVAPDNDDIINILCECGKYNDCRRLIPVDFETYRELRTDHWRDEIRSNECEKDSGHKIESGDNFSVWTKK
jgi:hypothetical protein